MGKNKRPPKKNRNLEVVFDQKKFVEFVTGFRKRKNERRTKAKIQVEQMVKAERKRIRLEVKNNMKHLKQSYAPLPPEDDIMLEKEKEYEEPEAIVKIIELSTRDMAKQEHLIGANCQDSSDDEDLAANKKSNTNNDTGSDDEDDENNVNIIPGMSLVKKPRNKMKKSVENVEQDQNFVQTKTKRDLDHIKQKKTLKSIAKSKVFKAKERMERLDNKKRSKRNKNNDIRQLKSQGRRIQKKPNFKRLNKMYGKNPHKKKK